MSGVTYTYKISNGEYIGMYAKGGKHGEGMCIPAKTKESKNQPSAAAKADPQAERSWWETVLFGGKTGGIAGCGDDGGAASVKEEFEEGVPMKQLEIDPDQGQKLDSGAVLIDDFVFLPEDEQGNPILPDDIFFEIEGTGRFFQETPEIVLLGVADDDKPLKGEGLQNLKLHVEMGTDSTLIDVPEMPEEGCYPGMIDVTEATLQDQEHGFYCRETDENGAEIYDDFAVCPSNPGKRLNVYLGSSVLENYEYMGLDENDKPIYQKKDEERNFFTTVQDLFLDLESGQKIPVVCGDAPLPIGMPISSDWHSDGNLYLKLRFKVIVDARHVDGNATYKTLLGVKIKSQEE